MRPPPFILKHFTWVLFFLTPLLIFADEFPVAPLSRTQTDLWGEVFRLSNRFFEIIISPEKDGIVSFREIHGNNLLDAPATLLPADRETLTEALPRLEGVPQPRWQARGWVTSEGGQTVLLTQTFGPPVHLRVTHLLSLPEDLPTFQWTTRITAIAPVGPELPVTFLLPSASLQWQSLWKIESGPELNTVDQPRDKLQPNLFRQTLASQPELFELPPQGWTLIIEGTLNLSAPESPDE